MYYTLRDASKVLNAPLSSTFRYIKSEQGRQTAVRTRPQCPPERHAEFLGYATELKSSPSHIDVDEGWCFAFHPSKGKILLLPPRWEGWKLSGSKPFEAFEGRVEVGSKRYLSKLMIVTAICRPMLVKGAGYVGGKVSISQCATTHEAQRRSKNHQKGDLYLKIGEGMNSDDYERIMVEDIIPSARASPCLAHVPSPLRIQSDNAPIHPKANSLSPRLARALMGDREEERECVLARQAPKNPQQNANDIGFYHGIWCGVDKHFTGLDLRRREATLDEIWSVVQHVFWSYPAEKIEIIFRLKERLLELQIESGGDNRFKVPHDGIRAAVMAEHLASKNG